MKTIKAICFGVFMLFANLTGVAFITVAIMELYEFITTRKERKL